MLGLKTIESRETSGSWNDGNGLDGCRSLGREHPDSCPVLDHTKNEVTGTVNEMRLRQFGPSQNVTKGWNLSLDSGFHKWG